MTPLRQAAATCTDIACATMGRGQVVRAARFVLRRARLDVPNDLTSNGESSLQQWILREFPFGRRAHVIDVGANVGRWSAAMLATARRAGRLTAVDLHAFEPSAETFTRLARQLRGQPVRLYKSALSDRAGWAELHVVGPGAGRNSLHREACPEPGCVTEIVATTTLDCHAERTRLDHVTLVKVDAEGHDLAVLRGARNLIAGHRIWAAQFEYNHRWIDARAYLRDAFELFQPYGYRLGKLTPDGIEFYPGWDAELETFVEGNYVACLPGLAERLPAVAWWKPAATHQVKRRATSAPGARA
jgi:FkbM family methyltransferase